VYQSSYFLENSILGHEGNLAGTFGANDFDPFLDTELIDDAREDVSCAGGTASATECRGGISVHCEGFGIGASRWEVEEALEDTDEVLEWGLSLNGGTSPTKNDSCDGMSTEGSSTGYGKASLAGDGE